MSWTVSEWKIFYPYQCLKYGFPPKIPPVQTNGAEAKAAKESEDPDWGVDAEKPLPPAPRETQRCQAAYTLLVFNFGIGRYEFEHCHYWHVDKSTWAHHRADYVLPGENGYVPEEQVEE